MTSGPTLDTDLGLQQQLQNFGVQMETVSTRDYTGVSTKQIIVEMLTESTGRSICDSGGSSGRNWQRNQGRDFAAEPAVTCTFSVWRGQGDEGPGRADPTPIVSLYHWMNFALKFDPEMQQQLDGWVEEHPDDPWLQVQEEFAEDLYVREDHDQAPTIVNTYNDDLDLDQVLQYAKVYKDGSDEPSHLIVSVHGGADVRGGYSAPKCFKLRRDYWEAWGAACVRGLVAGDTYWDYSGGGWSVCDTDSKLIQDVLATPCYSLDWLEDEPEVAMYRGHLSNLEVSIAGLDDGRYDALWVEKIKPVLIARIAELELELRLVVLRVLSDRHDTFTYVADQKLFLVEPGEFYEGKEVCTAQPYL